MELCELGQSEQHMTHLKEVTGPTWLQLEVGVELQCSQ
jgi:hypothetical protein